MDLEPIHITIPGSPDDPRTPRDFPEGVVVHYVPELHPDDVCVVGGMRVTTPARTLVDLADEFTHAELHEAVVQAVAMGLCTLDDIRASADRCEWRPSLPFLRSVLEQVQRR